MLKGASIPGFSVSFVSRTLRFGLFLTLCFIPFLKTAAAATPNLTVISGLLDLRETPLTDADGLVEIRGPWNFVPGQWITDQDESRVTFAEGDPAQFWQKSAAEDAERPRIGTYRLRIKQKENSPQLSLYLGDMPRYKLWVDGQAVIEHGVWLDGTNGVPWRGRHIVPLPYRAEMTIILQTAADDTFWQHWSLPLFIGTYQSTQGWILNQTIIIALILGGIFIVGIYHITLFILNHDNRAALYLGLWCLDHVLRRSLGSDVNIMFQLWPAFPYDLSFRLGYVAYYLTVPLYVHCLMLTFPGHVPQRTLWFFWAIALGFILPASVLPVGWVASMNWLYHFMTMAAGLVISFILFKSLKRKANGSRTLLVATLIVAASSANDILLVQGKPSFGETLPFALLIFIVLQGAILSSQFATTLRELRHTYSELTKIAYLHMVQRIAAGLRVEQTMPTGFAEATVLALDVVGSSQIQHPKFHAVLERMMGRCYAAVSEGYDPANLKSRAYRVKEMGDGMICTIGFPFPQLGEGTQAMDALRLAEDFARIFKEEMETLDLPDTLYCAIGIASGTIEGFFPKFGIKQYDLRGRAIVLATRYEAMRNLVYHTHGKQGSVIFIQDEVYKNLDARSQLQFQHWDSTLDHQRIRDNPSAKQAWFKFVEPARGTVARTKEMSQAWLPHDDCA